MPLAEETDVRNSARLLRECIMIELPLVFLGGLLGLGALRRHVRRFCRADWRTSADVVEQSCSPGVYSGGRIFTYCALGAAVGYGGLRLADGLGEFVNVQAMIAIVAGCC